MSAEDFIHHFLGRRRLVDLVHLPVYKMDSDGMLDDVQQITIRNEGWSDTSTGFSQGAVKNIF